MSATLGIIGGMGPKATAVFFNQIVDRTIAASDAEHIDIAILNNTKIPDRTEAIKKGNHKPVLDELLLSVRQLEYMGVKNIAIPCNTACYFINELRKITKIPIISIVEETAKYIKGLSDRRDTNEGVVVGVLATDGTISTNTYHKALSYYGLHCITPNMDLQAKVMELIYGQVKKTGKGCFSDFNNVVEEMEQSGCDYIILGCTDLSWFTANGTLSPRCIDALEILTKVCIERSGKEYSGPY